MIGNRKLLFSLMALALLAGPALAQWGPDKRIDSDTSSNYREFVTVCEAGNNIYSCWLDYRPPGSYYVPSLQFNRSTDNGATWGTDYHVNTGVTQGTAAPDYPDIACDETGQYVYCVWQDYRQDPVDPTLQNGSMPNVYFNRSTDYGATFEATDQWIDTGTSPNTHVVRYANVEASGSNVYVSWVDSRFGNRGVYFSMSPSYGASGTWTAPQPVDPLGGYLYTQDYADLACSGNNVYAAWQDSRISGSVHMNASQDGGVTWDNLTVARVDNGSSSSSIYMDLCAPTAVASKKARGTPPQTKPGPGSYTGMGTAAEGAHATNDILIPRTRPVYVCYRDYSNGSLADIYFNYSLDGGATWGATHRRMDVHTPAGSIWCGDPAVAASKNWVYVVWLDGKDDPTPGSSPYIDDIYIRYSNNFGQNSWIPNPVLMSDGVGPGAVSSWEPQVVASYPYVFVTFEDERDDQVTYKETVYCNYSTNGGISWNGDERVDITGLPSYDLYPTPFCEGRHLNVVWNDYRSGHMTYWNGRNF